MVSVSPARSGSGGGGGDGGGVWRGMWGASSPRWLMGAAAGGGGTRARNDRTLGSIRSWRPSGRAGSEEDGGDQRAEAGPLAVV